MYMFDVSSAKLPCITESIVKYIEYYRLINHCSFAAIGVGSNPVST